jgi:NurA-like 5'-3' nuclease
MLKYSYPTNERQKMIVEHSLKFVTEFADNHPVTQQMLRLDENTRIVMLESMLKELVGSRLQPILDEINANGSYAILKVAE